jgi:hypothetical protein
LLLLLLLLLLLDLMGKFKGLSKRGKGIACTDTRVDAHATIRFYHL